MNAADTLRPMLEAVGGLVSRSELAHEWGWSRQHVHTLAATPSFPKPVLHANGTVFYARNEAQEWYAAYIDRREAARMDPRGLHDGLGA